MTEHGVAKEGCVNLDYRNRHYLGCGNEYCSRLYQLGSAAYSVDMSAIQTAPLQVESAGRRLGNCEPLNVANPKAIQVAD